MPRRFNGPRVAVVPLEDPVEVRDRLGEPTRLVESQVPGHDAADEPAPAPALYALSGHGHRQADNPRDPREPS